MGAEVNFQVSRWAIEADQIHNLINVQEGSDGSSSFQAGKEEGSLHLIEFHGGRREIPYRQVGEGEEMN
jgi:REP element-mobilizing transposase RayT